MSDLRTDVFVRALETIIGTGTDDPAALFTDDVRVWSPAMNVSSREELVERLRERDDSLSDVTVLVRGLSSGGSTVIAEWRLDAEHTGPLVLDEELSVPATGRHIHIGGATFADFRGDRISSLRSYFDDMAVVEQLLATA